MKKLLVLITAFVFSNMIFAQKDVTEFMGIPVDGSLTSVVEKLKLKGFKLIEKDSDAAAFNGIFNGKDATLLVQTNERTNKVYLIGVMYEEVSESFIKETLSQFKNKDSYECVDTRDHATVFYQKRKMKDGFDENKRVVVGYTKKKLLIFYENIYNKPKSDGDDL